jgi:hypothetical protein
MRLLLLLFLAYFVLLAPVNGQQVSIELGKSPVPINQYYTISVKLQDQPLREIGAFPEIEGFKKSTKFSSTKTMIVGGNTTTVLTITQNYAALNEGSYLLKPFSIKANGKTIQSQGATIVVTAMADTEPQGATLPDIVVPNEQLDVLEGQPEYVEKKDNAFLTIYTNKNKVYVGEGLTVALYFYLAREDQRLLDFYDFAEQSIAILKQLKQSHVWEESFDFTEVIAENVTVEGKPYLRFKLYEAVLYPLTAKPIRFPQLSLKMIKYKVAANPSLLEDDRLEGYKTYFARAREIEVKQLPPHPMRDVVPVGIYRLTESLTQKRVEINKSFQYSFQIAGEGNLAAVMAPVPETPVGFDFYPPDIQQDVTRQNGRVYGYKTFTYTILPRVPGNYAFNEIFNWIYFNPVTAKYDTLQPALNVQIIAARDAEILTVSKDFGPFYNIIHREDAKLVKLNEFTEIKRYTNIILLLLLVIASFIFIKSKKL